MTDNLLDRYRLQFGRLVETFRGTAEALPDLSQAELERVNQSNADTLAELQLALSQTVDLPNGLEMVLRDYAALCELARVNDVSEEIIFGGVREIEDGRVVKAEFNDLSLTLISALSGLEQLNWLNLYNNRLTDISALFGLGKLKFLGLVSNQLTDISVLSGLEQLEWLYLTNNQLTQGSKSLVNQLRKREVIVTL